MAKKNQKVEQQPDQQPTPQPIAPAMPLELTDEQLEQVVGGGIIMPYGPSAMPDLDAGAHG